MTTQKIAVLVVEDEPFLRFDIWQEFSDSGLEVLEAAKCARSDRTPAEIVRLSRLTDVDMPGNLDGFELARIVKERFPPAHVVVHKTETPIAQRLRTAGSCMEALVRQAAPQTLHHCGRFWQFRHFPRPAILASGCQRSHRREAAGTIEVPIS